MLNKFLLSHWKVLCVVSMSLGLIGGGYYVLFCLPPLPKNCMITIPLTTFQR